jgi:hypothetical protein
MKTKAFLRSTLAVLALTAIPAAAVAQMKIIAIQAKVGGSTYGVAPNQEVVPVNVGDRVRLELVGTSIEQGRGVERPVSARFDVAAGRGRIDIAQAGPNWAVLTIRSSGEAQLGYSVARGYDMRGGMQSGRITFDIADRGGRGGHGNGPYPPGQNNDERRNRARELTRQLYHGILNESPRGDDRRDEVEQIYRNGSAGVRDVALTLARSANVPRRLGQDEATRILGNLYRDLLRRDMSDRDLWARDRGFRGNIDTLRRDGFVRIVDVIVSSEEFHSANRLSELDRMPRGGDGRDGRYDRRGDDRDHRDRRPPGL